MLLQLASTMQLRIYGGCRRPPAMPSISSSSCIYHASNFPRGRAAFLHHPVTIGLACHASIGCVLARMFTSLDASLIDDMTCVRACVTTYCQFAHHSLHRRKCLTNLTRCLLARASRFLLHFFVRSRTPHFALASKQYNTRRNTAAAAGD